MNTIDQLIGQAGIRGAFDVRCLYRGDFALPHAQSPAGVMPFHLLMRGEIRVTLPDGASTLLQPGDLLLLPGGEAHTIWRDEKPLPDIGSVEDPLPLRGDGEESLPNIGSTGGPLLLRGDGEESVPNIGSTEGPLPTRSNGGESLPNIGSTESPLPTRGDGGNEVEFLCGEFRYQGPLRPLLLDALPSPLRIPLLGSESRQALELVLALIHQELNREQQGSGAVLTALSQVLLAMGLRAHASDPNGALGLIGALQDTRIGRSLQAMLATPAHPWSVDELATLAAMSRATYFRHFRQRLGCSVWEFMVRVRMVRAGELLRQPDHLPIGEVAQRVGYQSEAAFTKAFKQLTGLAPGKFRQQGLAASAPQG